VSALQAERLSIVDDPWLNSVQTAAVTGYSQAGLRTAVKHGRFPQPVRLAPNVLRWRRSVIDAWVAEHEQKGAGRAAS
jgi:predicted DNA-binding transcriptional regulator AlpA